MTCLRSLLLMILAVLALATPSVAAGVGTVPADQTPLAVTAVDADARTPVFRPCTRHGGKSMLPCHPELGVPVAAASPPPWVTMPAPLPASDLALPEEPPKVDPPPPRRR